VVPGYFKMSEAKQTAFKVLSPKSSRERLSGLPATIFLPAERHPGNIAKAKMIRQRKKGNSYDRLQCATRAIQTIFIVRFLLCACQPIG
jgi:hypothetical protein